MSLILQRCMQALYFNILRRSQQLVKGLMRSDATQIASSKPMDLSWLRANPVCASDSSALSSFSGGC